MMSDAPIVTTGVSPANHSSLSRTSTRIPGRTAASVQLNSTTTSLVLNFFDLAGNARALQIQNQYQRGLTGTQTLRTAGGGSSGTSSA